MGADYFRSTWNNNFAMLAVAMQAEFPVALEFAL